MSRRALQVVCVVVFAIVSGTNAASQAQPSKVEIGSNDSQSAVITDVRLVDDRGAPAIEIVCSRSVIPGIRSVDGPPRIIIDLPNSRLGMQKKRVDVLRENVLTIRLEEYREKTPRLRIVVNFLVPFGFAWDAEGDHIMVRLKAPEDPYVASKKSAIQQAQSASLAPVAKPAFVPVSGGFGDVVLAGKRFAAGSSITAGSETAVLQLSRGGEVRVCPGTSLSVTPAKGAQDLMMGLSTGAMEAHYILGASADTILTPDFRILFAGPGEFDYAISSDSRGNTCVRGLGGNASSVIVSELIGDRIYQVKPAEQAVFHNGRIDKVDSDVPPECGCAAPPPVMRTEANAPHVVPDSESANLTIAQASPSSPSRGQENAAPIAEDSKAEGPKAFSAGPETRPLPKGDPREPQVEVEAPLVFRGRAGAKVPPDVTDEAAALPAMEPSRTVMLEARALPPVPAPTPRRGILQHIRGFFASIFH